MQSSRHVCHRGRLIPNRASLLGRWELPNHEEAISRRPKLVVRSDGGNLTGIIVVVLAFLGQMARVGAAAGRVHARPSTTALDKSSVLCPWHTVAVTAYMSEMTLFDYLPQRLQLRANCSLDKYHSTACSE